PDRHGPGRPGRGARRARGAGPRAGAGRSVERGVGHARRDRARRARARDPAAVDARRRAARARAARRDVRRRTPGGGRVSMATPLDRRPNALTDADHTWLRHLLHERTGVVLDASREHFAEMRLGGLATEWGLDSLPELLEALRTEEGWGVLHRLVVE